MKIANNIQQEPFLWIDFKIDNFQDFKALAQVWSVDFLQLDGVPFYSELQQMILPEVHVDHTNFNCHLDQKGVSPDDMWSFVIIGEDASMFKFNHETTQSTSTMVIYSPGSEINAVSYAGFEVYILSVAHEHLVQLTQSLGMDKIEEKLAKIDRVELDTLQASSLRNLLKDILNNASSLKHKIITSEGKKLLLNFVPIKFLKEIGKQVGCAEEKLVQEKNMLFMEVRSYIHTHLDEILNFEEIAKKFNITGRSLRNYFKEELDTSPKQYLTVLRLTKVRDELKVAKMEKGLVEKTARRFGFTHMGQFAKSYKDFFGELPSETLFKS